MIRNLFNSGPKKSEEPKAVGSDADPFELHPPRTPKGLNPQDTGEFAARMAEFRSHHLKDDKGRGALVVLDLTSLRYRFGQGWRSMREKAFRHIESVIAKRLNAQELYLLADQETAYLLVSGRERRQADILGSTVAVDITERLCGAVPTGPTVRFKTLPFNFDDGLSGVVSGDQFLERIHAFNQSLDEQEQSMFEQSKGDLRLFFYPTLDMNTGSVFTYHATPKIRSKDHKLLPPEDACAQSVNGVFVSELDKWCLQEVAKHLGAREASRSPLLVSPVNYETIASKRLREGFLARCRELPPIATDRLALELIGISPAIPQGRILELVSYIKSYCNRLLVRVSPGALNLENLQSCSISGVTYDLGVIDPAAPETKKLIENMASGPRLFSMDTTMIEVSSVELGNLALKAGISRIYGPAFIRAREKPGPILDASTSRPTANPSRRQRAAAS